MQKNHKYRRIKKVFKKQNMNFLSEPLRKSLFSYLNIRFIFFLQRLNVVT